MSIDKFNGESLHIYQGELTHQNSKTFMKFSKESDSLEGDFYTSKLIVSGIHHKYVSIGGKSKEFLDAKKKNGRIHANMKKAMVAVTEAEKW